MDKQKAVRKAVGQEGAFVDMLNQEMKELQDGLKQKQIEEMEKDIEYICSDMALNCCDNTPCCACIAKGLERKGWIKPNENAVVLTETERITMSVEQWDKGYNQARNETAEKFARLLKERLHYDVIPESGITDEKNVFESIDEICNEIMEDKNGD